MTKPGGSGTSSTARPKGPPPTPPYPKPRAFDLPKIELGCRFVHNPDLVLAFTRRVGRVANELKPPNELKIVVARARNLPIMDRHALLHRTGGSTDPFVKLHFDGDEAETNVLKKDLDPVWNEVVAMPVELLLEGETLEVQCLDHETLGGGEHVGSVHLELKPLIEQRTTTRKWYPFCKKDVEGQILPPQVPPRLGKLELATRWVHNPKLVIPCPKALLKDKHKDKPGNELRTCVIRVEMRIRARRRAGRASTPTSRWSFVATHSRRRREKEMPSPFLDVRTY